MNAAFAVLALVLGVAIALAASSVRVLREYERGVVFRLGRHGRQRNVGT